MSTEGTSTTGTDSDTDPITATDTDTGTSTGTGTDGDEPINYDASKQRIYQLTVRLFSNTKAINQGDGDISTNGVGKFAEIDEIALSELREMGYSHIWLHGVLQQATLTEHPELEEIADDPDTVKGKAGSYYAIRDYFDVSADYATDPLDRLTEFKALVDRIHDADMKVLIDFVPNHVARSYGGNIADKTNFGAEDDPSIASAPTNNFFYLIDPPGQQLILPTPEWWTPPGMPDNAFDLEDSMPLTDVPRVTGNNVDSSTPAVTDWYDTVKLNYGYDFVEDVSAYDPQPSTWADMDDVLSYWQDMGVDGFRVDSAHYVPIEFWTWAIAQARSRDPEVYFVAEAYEGDPNGVPGFSLTALLDTGFDAVYDDVLYDTIKNVFCCGGEANSITALLDGTQPIADKLLRYSENHDERRLASGTGMTPDKSGFGSAVAGLPASALLYLLGPGPLLVYNGQEVGEPGSGSEGYGQEDGRTTIYDYWSMPNLRGWVNDHAYDGGQLGAAEQELRATYRRLIALSTRDAFASGEFISLQDVNEEDSNTYCSKGRWCYTFIRHSGDEVFLVTVNINPNNMYTLDLKIPENILTTLGLGSATDLIFEDRMLPDSAPITAEVAKLTDAGIKLVISKSQIRIFAVTPAR